MNKKIIKLIKFYFNRAVAWLVAWRAVVWLKKVIGRSILVRTWVRRYQNNSFVIHVRSLLLKSHPYLERLTGINSSNYMKYYDSETKYFIKNYLRYVKKRGILNLWRRPSWFLSKAHHMNFQTRWIYLQNMYLEQNGLGSRSYFIWFTNKSSSNNFTNLQFHLYFNVREIIRFLRLLKNPMYTLYFTVISEIFSFENDFIMHYKKKQGDKFWFLDNFFFSNFNSMSYVFKYILIDLFSFSYLRGLYGFSLIESQSVERVSFSIGAHYNIFALLSELYQVFILHCYIRGFEHILVYSPRVFARREWTDFFWGNYDIITETLRLYLPHAYRELKNPRRDFISESVRYLYDYDYEFYFNPYRWMRQRLWKYETKETREELWRYPEVRAKYDQLFDRHAIQVFIKSYIKNIHKYRISWRPAKKYLFAYLRRSAREMLRWDEHLGESLSEEAADYFFYHRDKLWYIPFGTARWTVNAEKEARSRKRKIAKEARAKMTLEERAADDIAKRDAKELERERRKAEKLETKKFKDEKLKTKNRITEELKKLKETEKRWAEHSKNWGAGKKFFDEFVLRLRERKQELKKDLKKLKKEERRPWAGKAWAPAYEALRIFYLDKFGLARDGKKLSDSSEIKKKPIKSIKRQISITQLLKNKPLKKQLSKNELLDMLVFIRWRLIILKNEQVTNKQLNNERPIKKLLERQQYFKKLYWKQQFYEGEYEESPCSERHPTFNYDIDPKKILSRLKLDLTTQDLLDLTTGKEKIKYILPALRKVAWLKRLLWNFDFSPRLFSDENLWYFKQREFLSNKIRQKNQKILQRYKKILRRYQKMLQINQKMLQINKNKWQTNKNKYEGKIKFYKHKIQFYVDRIQASRSLRYYAYQNTEKQQRPLKPRCLIDHYVYKYLFKSLTSSNKPYREYLSDSGWTPGVFKKHFSPKMPKSKIFIKSITCSIVMDMWNYFYSYCDFRKLIIIVIPMIYVIGLVYMKFLWFDAKSFFLKLFWRIIFYMRDTYLKVKLLSKNLFFYFAVCVIIYLKYHLTWFFMLFYASFLVCIFLALLAYKIFILSDNKKIKLLSKNLFFYFAVCVIIYLKYYLTWFFILFYAGVFFIIVLALLVYLVMLRNILILSEKDIIFIVISIIVVGWYLTGFSFGYLIFFSIIFILEFFAYSYKWFIIYTKKDPRNPFFLSLIYYDYFVNGARPLIYIFMRLSNGLYWHRSALKVKSAGDSFLGYQSYMMTLLENEIKMDIWPLLLINTKYTKNIMYNKYLKYNMIFAPSRQDLGRKKMPFNYVVIAGFLKILWTQLMLCLFIICVVTYNFFFIIILKLCVTLGLLLPRLVKAYGGALIPLYILKLKYAVWSAFNVIIMRFFMLLARIITNKEYSVKTDQYLFKYWSVLTEYSLFVNLNVNNNDVIFKTLFFYFGVFIIICLKYTVTWFFVFLYGIFFLRVCLPLLKAWMRLNKTDILWYIWSVIYLFNYLFFYCGVCVIIYLKYSFTDFFLLLDDMFILSILVFNLWVYLQIRFKNITEVIAKMLKYIRYTISRLACIISIKISLKDTRVAKPLTIRSNKRLSIYTIIVGKYLKTIWHDFIIKLLYKYITRLNLKFMPPLKYVVKFLWIFFSLFSGSFNKLIAYNIVFVNYIYSFRDYFWVTNWYVMLNDGMPLWWRGRLFFSSLKFNRSYSFFKGLEFMYNNYQSGKKNVYFSIWLFKDILGFLGASFFNWIFFFEILWNRMRLDYSFILTDYNKTDFSFLKDFFFYGIWPQTNLKTQTTTSFMLEFKYLLYAIFDNVLLFNMFSHISYDKKTIYNIYIKAKKFIKIVFVLIRLVLYFILALLFYSILFFVLLPVYIFYFIYLSCHILFIFFFKSPKL